MGWFCFAPMVQGQGYNLNGSAVALGGDCYRLTPNVNWQNGTVWYTDQLDLRQPFDLEFEVYLGTNDAGADGIMFVLQTVGNTALGYNGGGMGFGGFSPSLGIEFDTFQNLPSSDPVNDHLAIQRDGNTDHASPNNLAGPFPIPINIENGQNHHARVTWDPVAQNLGLYFKCIFVTSFNYNLVDSIFAGNPIVYWGFTSATGGLSNEQRVCVERNVLSVQDRFDICLGDSAHLQSFGAGIGGSYSWAPNYFITNVNTQSPVAFPPHDTTYIVTFTDICGGTENDTVEVFVHPPPAFSLGPDTLFCPNEIVTLSPDILWPSAGLTWSNNSIGTTLDITTSGLFWLEQDVFGCVFRDSLVATTIAMPPLNLGPDPNKCPEDSLFLNVQQPGAMYQWQNGSNLSSFTVSSPGTYWVDLSANGCTLRDSLIVSDFTSPTVNLPSPQNLCAGSSVVLDPQNPGLVYTWSTNATTPTLTVATAGLYRVGFEDGNGCEGRDSVLVIEVPLPIVNLPSDTAVCVDEMLVLDANEPGLSYQWSTGSTTSQTTVSNSGPVTVLFTDGNNCINQDTVEVVFHPLPTINLPADTLLCEGEMLVLDPGDPGLNYIWSNGNNSSTLVVTDPGVYQVNFVDANGCTGEDSVSVLSVPVIEVELGPDLNLCGNENVVLDAQNPGATYVWSTGATGQMLEIEETGQFSVLVSNECFSDRDTVVIEIQTEGGLFVPTGFTPNGDGINDEFFISALNVPEFELVIFDRWGSEIFQSTSPAIAWTGMSSGKPVPEGVYTFLIKYTNCSEQPDMRQGSVTLIR